MRRNNGASHRGNFFNQSKDSIMRHVKNWRSHLNHKQTIRLSVAVVAVLGILGLAYSNFLSGKLQFRASTDPITISNNATVQWCSEGETANNGCDPANNTFSGSATSNTVTTTVTPADNGGGEPTDDPGDGDSGTPTNDPGDGGNDPAPIPKKACFVLPLEEFRLGTRVRIEAMDTSNNTLAKTRVAYNPANITITDSTFVNAHTAGQTYKYELKADRSLAATAQGNAVDSCVTVATAPEFGDFYGDYKSGDTSILQVIGDGQFNAQDLTTAIRLYVQKTDTELSSPDLVNLIRRYVNKTR